MTQNNGHTNPTGLPPEVLEALAKDLDPALIASREGGGGKLVDYLEGSIVIDQANSIFGHDGWGYEIVDGPQLQVWDRVHSKSGEVSRIMAYTAKVKVTVIGAPPRVDVGFCSVRVPRNATSPTLEGYNTAYKGATTDGLKRAFRTFGKRFGNLLYTDPPPEYDEIAANPTRGVTMPEESVNVPTDEASGEQAAPTPPKPSVNGAQSDHSGDENGQAERGSGTGTSRGSKSARSKKADQLRKQLEETMEQLGHSKAETEAAVLRKKGKAMKDLGAADLEPLLKAAQARLEKKKAEDLVGREEQEYADAQEQPA